VAVTTGPTGTPAPPVPPGPIRRRPKLRYWVAAVACLAAVAYLIFGGLAGNVIYFRTVPEALALQAKGDTVRFRLAGNVVPGTVEHGGGVVRFDVTDGNQVVHVVNTGSPPELFKDGAPVVCEGRWDRSLAFFASDDILIKHGSEYTPPSQGVYPSTTALARP
jgi:cytochrome c-type biogenesis protein CcmE